MERVFFYYTIYGGCGILLIKAYRFDFITFYRIIYCGSTKRLINFFDLLKKYKNTC